MKHTIQYLAAFCALFFLSGCHQAPTESTPSIPIIQDTQPSTEQPIVSTQINPDEMFTNRDFQAQYDNEKTACITFAENTVTSTTDAARINGNTVTLTDEGTYLLSGKWNNGQVIIHADKTDKIHLVLKNVSIHSNQSAPILILQADKVFITLADGTENSLANGGTFSQNNDANVDAIIFSKEDLTLNGTGSLALQSPAGHGIVSKDDLVITGGNYTIESASHGICGKNSFRIAGGSFQVTAGKDGLHAENQDDASSGFGYIQAGEFTLNVQGDGISASNALTLCGGSYDITAGGGSENATKEHTESMGGFGGGGPGGFGGGGPGGFGSGRPGGGFPGEQFPGNDSSAEQSDTVSMKGIKSGGDLQILDGSFRINSADDAIHSNLNIQIAGGSFQLATGDDGIHADERLRVSGCELTVLESYEGLEGLHILIEGGEIRLKSSDDGLNAAGGTDQSGFGGNPFFDGGKGDFGGMSSGTGSIKISGGNLYINASGDGIDANGTLEISGGCTQVCGPTRGDTATLDYDKYALITGGTFIGTGASGMAQTFSGSENQGVISIQVGSVSEGTPILLTDETGAQVLSYTPELSYQVVIISTPDIQKGKAYTVTIADQSGTFTAN